MTCCITSTICILQLYIPLLQNQYYVTCCRISRQSDWRKIREGELPSIPSLYRGTFEVTEEPKDTFLHMKGWTKGVCFINGHNLGRYWQIGPQETLYLPAPWLNKGHNEVCYLKCPCDQKNKFLFFFGFQNYVI